MSPVGRRKCLIEIMGGVLGAEGGGLCQEVVAYHVAELRDPRNLLCTSGGPIGDGGGRVRVSGTPRTSMRNMVRTGSVAPDVRWVQVPHLLRCGRGVEIWHRCVSATAVAFIDGFGWLKRPRSRTVVEVLRLRCTYPPRIKKHTLADRDLRGWPGTKWERLGAREGYLAKDRPDVWYGIIAEVHAAVFLCLRDRPPHGREERLRRRSARITPNVVGWWND